MISSPEIAMTIPHTSLRGCCPIIQLLHAIATTAPKSAALSIPDTSLSGPLFAHSTAIRDTFLFPPRNGKSSK